MSARPPEDDSRLSSPKAVKSMLLLAIVVLAAAAVFVWVVLAKACSSPASSRARRGTGTPFVTEASIPWRRGAERGPSSLRSSG